MAISSLSDIPIRLAHVLRTPSRVDEEILALFNILFLNLLALASTDIRHSPAQAVAAHT
jgi:hypothetical protein